MAAPNSTRMLMLACAALVLARPSLAEDQVRIVDPAPPAPAGGGLAALFSQQRAAAVPQEPSTPLDIRPSREAISVAVRTEAKPKLADVPPPPRPPREEPAAASAATTQSSSVKGLPPPVTAAFAQPASASAAPTGFFGWLASINTDPAPQDPERVASLGAAPRRTNLDLSNPFRPRSLPGDDQRDDDLEDEESSKKLVEKQTDYVNIACLKPRLMRLINAAGAHFKGTPVITSGFRDRGRRGSYHRRCEAADFFITGVSSSALTGFLKTLPGAGGVGTYCHTKSVHIDTGEPRNWHQCGFRRSFAMREPVMMQTARR